MDFSRSKKPYRLGLEWILDVKNMQMFDHSFPLLFFCFYVFMKKQGWLDFIA